MPYVYKKYTQNILAQNGKRCEQKQPTKNPSQPQGRASKKYIIGESPFPMKHGTTPMGI